MGQMPGPGDAPETRQSTLRWRGGRKRREGARTYPSVVPGCHLRALDVPPKSRLSVVGWRRKR